MLLEKMVGKNDWTMGFCCLWGWGLRCHAPKWARITRTDSPCKLPASGIPGDCTGMKVAPSAAHQAGTRPLESGGEALRPGLNSSTSALQLGIPSLTWCYLRTCHRCRAECVTDHNLLKQGRAEPCKRGVAQLGFGHQASQHLMTCCHDLPCKLQIPIPSLWPGQSVRRQKAKYDASGSCEPRVQSVISRNARRPSWFLSTNCAIPLRQSIAPLQHHSSHHVQSHLSHHSIRLSAKVNIEAPPSSWSKSPGRLATSRNPSWQRCQEHNNDTRTN